MGINVHIQGAPPHAFDKKVCQGVHTRPAKLNAGPKCETGCGELAPLGANMSETDQHPMAVIGHCDYLGRD